MVQAKKTSTKDTRSNDQSQAKHPAVKALYKLILEQERQPWKAANQAALLAAVEGMDVPALEALRKDLLFWTVGQKLLLEDIVQAEEDLQKVALFARIIYTDLWALKTDKVAMYEVYFPIFLFSIYKFKAIDSTYRTTVLARIQDFTTEERTLLKKEAVQWPLVQQEELYRVIGSNIALNPILKDLLNYKTKEVYTSCSSNPKVIEVYLLVMEEERNGYAYEHAYLGNNNLLQNFTKEDWKALKVDLPHWKNHHLEAFTHGVLEYDFPTNQRLPLLLLLLRISQEKNRPPNEISSIMIEEEAELNANLLELLHHSLTSLAPIKALLAALQVQSNTTLFVGVRKKIKALEQGF